MSDDQEINVPMSAERAAHIKTQDAFWTGPRLCAFAAAFLGTCLVIIYVLANLPISQDSPPF